MKKVPILLLLISNYFIGFSQPKLVEKVAKTSPGEIVIPYEKYVYPNGLTLLVHEDHSDPICHVDVTYHVGSAREEIGKSGFAHFFEHMMFQGSDHVADEQHFKIITEAGGTLNGSTNRDRTNYFETVPNNQLEKMLWLESDRMGFLYDAVTQKKFEIQRATVKNERGQNYDNRPYGLVQETLSKNLFPYGHPYSWLTIGYVEDLNRVNVQDLNNFFLRWYGPNNAVVTVGGDVNTSEVVKLVEKYFGPIPAGPKVEKTILPQPIIDKDRYVKMVDGYAKLPMLNCALVGVPSFHKDEAALECLGDIIGGGNSSILYQRLVKTQKALRANSYHMGNELAGSFQIVVMPQPGTPLSEMEKEIRAALAEFEKRGVTDDDLAKFKQSSEAQKIFQLEYVSGKVSQLAYFETFTGNPNYIKTDLKQIQSVTKEDIMRVYTKYVKDKPMVILSVLTKGSEQLAAAENNYVIDSSGYKAPNCGYNGLVYNKPASTFDRNVIPGSGPNPVVKVPSFKQMSMQGMKAIYSKNDEIPAVVIAIGLKGGRLVEQSQLEKAGLASLFSEMMNEDTKKSTAEQMNTKLEKLGSSIDFDVSADEIQVSVRTLKKNLKPTLDLLEERLLMPVFKQETFNRIKNQTIEGIKNSKARAAQVASTAFSKLSYGEKNVFGWPGSGTESTVGRLSLADVEEYYKKYWSKENLELVVVGDAEESDVKDILTRLNKLPNTKITLPALPALPNIEAGSNTIYLVNIPKAAQTEFRMGFASNLVYDAIGEYYRCGLMNFPLGGAFNSRINIKLREEKGWTYGAGSRFGANDYFGNFTFSAGIKTPATDSALVEIVSDMEGYAKGGISTEELSFLKNAIGQSDARKYESLSQKASFIGNILEHNLEPSFVNEQNKILSEIKPDEINRLASKWIDLKKMRIVLAGDKEFIQPRLEKLGYRVVEITSDGDLK